MIRVYSIEGNINGVFTLLVARQQFSIFPL